jgi:hypothetical protein
VTPAPGERRRLHGLSRRKKAEYVLEDAVRQGFYAASAPGHWRYCPLGRLPRRHSVEQAAGVDTLWNKKRLHDVRVSGAGANREDKRRTESPAGCRVAASPRQHRLQRWCRGNARRLHVATNSRAAAGTGNGGGKQNQGRIWSIGAVFACRHSSIFAKKKTLKVCRINLRSNHFPPRNPSLAS